MMGTILQIGFFSFLFIYVTHSMFIYLTETLTSTKVKNYEASHTYQSILDTLQHQPQPKYVPPTNIGTSAVELLPELPSDVTQISNIPFNDHDENQQEKKEDAPNSSDNTMKDELKIFMKLQMN